jgi:hypothetical protein
MQSDFAFYFVSRKWSPASKDRLLCKELIFREFPQRERRRKVDGSNTELGRRVDISTLMKPQFIAFAAVLGLGTLVQANADEIQFVTLPQVVRTTVVREGNIPDETRVTRVLRDENGVYEVTVRRDTDNEVLFVDPAGRLVRQQTVAVAAPVRTTQTTQTTQAAQVSQPLVTQTVTESAAAPTVDTFIRSLDDARYQLVEKKGNKEVYRDRNTGTRWVVKVEREDD